MKQTKVQKSARGEECTLHIAGVCNYNVETTVLAHVGFCDGSGKRIRVGERNAVYACSSCHDAIDGRVIQAGWSNWIEKEYWYIARALVRTTERRDILGV